ncbi:DUF397 domain-containing protein [Streptomyces sp. DSM 15324]|uniref:DUF397 domain-containing protein n=1 Tax=Streptomyces sp. DSM 15324 TaxID=1739111 RepID=UPI00099E7CDB|nr:DUF397 domain-containing protein [Streptomyces sp. DSM 15324]
MATPDGTSRPKWFTSSYSNGAGGECVQCAFTGDGIVVRDSKSEGGPEVFFGRWAWLAFVHAVRPGLG